MPTSSELRFAVFDLDGTLIDSVEAIVSGVTACWEACGFPVPEPDSVRRIIGLPWEESVLELLPGAGDAEFGKIRDYYKAVRAGEVDRPPVAEDLFDGAISVLNALEDDGYVLGVVTSRGHARALDLFETHGLHGRFVTLKTPDHGPGKPNPHLLLEAMSEVGAEPGRTVMIGDTTFDIEMAINARTRAIGVSWGVHAPDELTGAGAHAVVHRFDELTGCIDDLTGEAKQGS